MLKSQKSQTDQSNSEDYILSDHTWQNVS